MKPDEIRDLPTRELRQRIEDGRQELFNLRFQIETRKIKNNSRLGEVKRDIARMLTILRERELIAAYTGVEFEEGSELAPTTTAEAGRRGLFGLGRRRG